MNMKNEWKDGDVLLHETGQSLWVRQDGKWVGPSGHTNTYGDEWADACIRGAYATLIHRCEVVQPVVFPDDKPADGDVVLNDWGYAIQRRDGVWHSLFGEFRTPEREVITDVSMGRYRILHLAERTPSLEDQWAEFFAETAPLPDEAGPIPANGPSGDMRRRDSALARALAAAGMEPPSGEDA